MYDSLAHQAENLADAGDDVIFRTEHERELACCSTDDSSGHGSVDETALATAMCLVGYICRGHGVDRAAVDEETLLPYRCLSEKVILLKNLFVDRFDVLRFRQDGNDVFL